MKRQLSILEYKLPVTIQSLKEGGFLAVCKKLQGCLAEGETIAQTMANLVDVATHIIDIRHQERLPIPLVKKQVRRSQTNLSFSLPLPYAVA